MTGVGATEVEIVFLLVTETEIVGGLPDGHEAELLRLLIDDLLELLEGRPDRFLAGANFGRGVGAQRVAQVVALARGQQVQLCLLQGLGEPLACSFKGLMSGYRLILESYISVGHYSLRVRVPLLLMVELVEVDMEPTIRNIYSLKLPVFLG